jgi:hypothetical protein
VDPILGGAGAARAIFNQWVPESVWDITHHLYIFQRKVNTLLFSSFDDLLIEVLPWGLCLYSLVNTLLKSIKDFNNKIISQIYVIPLKYFDFQQFIDSRRSVSQNLARYNVFVSKI